MNKAQVWLQVFLSAMQTFIQVLHPAPPHQIAAAARTMADEAVGNIHPMVFDPEVGGLVPKAQPTAELQPLEVFDTESEMEQARRQPPMKTDPARVEEAAASETTKA